MSKKRILVVDDMPLMRTMLNKYITRVGAHTLKEEYGIDQVEVIEAANGAEALEVLDQGGVDLIFLDIMMSEMDGITFLEEMKKRRGSIDIPIVVISALSEKSVVDRALALGAANYMTKPFSLKVVEEKLREVFSAEKAT